jgi:hypothetical protein
MKYVTKELQYDPQNQGLNNILLSVLDKEQHVYLTVGTCNGIYLPEGLSIT